MVDEKQIQNWEVSFGPFRLSKPARFLERDGRRVHLGGRAFDILVHLVEHPTQVVSKQDLLAAVWPRLIVEEGSLRFHISELRKALGDDGRQYIVNVPGRGYCFAGPITSQEYTGSTLQQTVFPIAPPRAIPSPVSLIGRASSVDKIVELLSSRRIVSIIAAGGMGKTSVATAAAHQLAPRFRDDICFVELGLVEDPTRVTDAFAIALGLPIKSANPLDDILHFVQSKQMLILVDGCEHVINESANLIEEIVVGSADVHILSTSRETLRVEGEWVFHLEPLASAPIDGSLTASNIGEYPAAQLFMDRAEAAMNAKLSDRDIELLVPICCKLDGLPLAIELAASQSPLLSLHDLADALADDVILELPGRRTSPPRHQSLSRMLDWSYRLLTELEQCMLQYMSIFRGPFELDAAIAMMQGKATYAQAASALAQLSSKSLLNVDRTETATRYRLLDTTKAYARSKLMESGDFTDACHSHARLYADALKGLQAPSSDQALRRLASQFEDISAAISWGFQPGGDIPLSIELVAAGIPIWQYLHLFQNAKDCIEKALSHLDHVTISVDVELALRNCFALSVMLISGFTEEFTAAWSRVSAVAEAAQQLDLQIVALLRLWSQQVLLSDARRAQEYAEKFHRLAHTERGSLWTGIADWYMGSLRYLAGNFVDARAYLERAAGESRQEAIDTQRDFYGYDCRVSGMAFLSSTILMQGEVSRARDLIEQAIKQGLSEDNDVSLCTAQGHATYGLIMIGSFEEAEPLAREYLKQAEERALGNFYSLACACLGLIRLWRGDDGGLKQLDFGLLDMRRMGYPDWVHAFMAERLRVLIERDHGRVDGIRLAALDTSESNTGGWGWYLAEAVRLNGRLAQIQGDKREAERLFSSALQVARFQSSPIWELRVANDLVQLWISDKRRDRGRALLEDVCSKISCRAPIKDLIQAKALLASL